MAKGTAWFSWWIDSGYLKDFAVNHTIVFLIAGMCATDAFQYGSKTWVCRHHSNHDRDRSKFQTRQVEMHDRLHASPIGKWLSACQSWTELGASIFAYSLKVVYATRTAFVHTLQKSWRDVAGKPPLQPMWEIIELEQGLGDFLGSDSYIHF